MKDLIIAILGVALVSAMLLYKKPVKENFWGLPNRTVRVDREYAVKSQCDGNTVMYSVPPNYQSMLEPRFSNVNYGAHIKYNLPCQDHLGSPHYPLTFQGDVKENYHSCSNSCSSPCLMNSEPVCSRQEKMTTCSQINKFSDEAKMGLVRDDDGIIPQVINYERLIYANQKSRLYGRGDPIRGDLPIVPVNDGWFRPSVNANIDLRQGAINVIAGSDNCTSNALRALQYESSGKSLLSQKHISLGAAQGDIVVTAFP